MDKNNSSYQNGDNSKKILVVSNLNVSFWVNRKFYPAVKNVNFTLSQNEVLALVGETGSGKSTTAMSILGLLPKNSIATGSVKLEGKEILNTRKEKLRVIRGSKIASIFQEPMNALNPVYTVGFQIAEAIRLHNPDLGPERTKKRVIELIDLVGIKEPELSYKKYPHQLSGGQRQRAMIAQAISCDPVLLIADEPTTALDVTVQAEILDLLRDLHKRINSAILIITHDLGVVADFASTVMVMRNGAKVEIGNVFDIYANPKADYTKELIAAVPKMQDVEAQVTGESNSALDLNGEKATKKDNQIEPTIVFENVSIDYPKQGRNPAFRAAKNINLKIYPNEIVGLVGESGSGKTTLGRAAVGLLPIASGRLVTVGKDISKAKHRDLFKIRHKTGIIFQDPASSLNPRLSIGESIAEPILLAGKLNKIERNKRVETLLEQVELPRYYRNRFPHELSGGQKQRVGIARSLALSPKLLIADEPTSALDVSVQDRFLQLLEEIQAQLQFACIFISHDLAVVDTLSDRIAVMKDGEIVETGNNEQIFRNSQNSYTQRLIEAIPVPDPIVQKERSAQRLLKRNQKSL